MKKRVLTVISILALSVAFLCTAQAYEALNGAAGVLKYDPSLSYGGYTVIDCTATRDVFLIDMEGYIVHTWRTDLVPRHHSRLLPNGHLLRPGRAGSQSVIQELDWDGNVVWEYRTPPGIDQHHTLCRMPNGNTMLLCSERVTKEQAIALGRGADKVGDSGITFDCVLEVNPAGQVVWEWHLKDHLGTGPLQWNINWIRTPRDYTNADWSHFNTVEYIPETDQMIVNSRHFGEFYLINHQTGAMEYRWGNPCVYGGGECPSYWEDGDQQLFGPHNVQRLDNGNFLIFDNGFLRPEGMRSRILELNPTTGEIAFQWSARDGNSFYTSSQGSVQKLPNGNYHITSTTKGHLFEITPDGKIAWEFVSPVTAAGNRCFYEDQMSNSLHRSFRYGPEYFPGRTLTRQGLLDAGCPQEWQTNVEPTVQRPTVTITGGTFTAGQRLTVTATVTGGTGPYDIITGARWGTGNAATTYCFRENGLCDLNHRLPVIRNYIPDGNPITVLDYVVGSDWGSFEVPVFVEVVAPGGMTAIASATTTLTVNGR